jgi:hypothetical protein
MSASNSYPAGKILTYALFENGHHPETIVELSREIELDMRGKFASPDHIQAASTRRVA